jgi:hypothetical protein
VGLIDARPEEFTRARSITSMTSGSASSARRTASTSFEEASRRNETLAALVALGRLTAAEYETIMTLRRALAAQTNLSPLHAADLTSRAREAMVIAAIDLGDEVSKAAINFVFVAIVGGAAAALFGVARRRRELDLLAL